MIVDATAYAPCVSGARASRQFKIRLVVKRPDRPALLPLPPQGLNPLMSPPAAEMRAWHEAVERAKRSSEPGERLIDKTLTVTGERHFVKRAPAVGVLAALVDFVTMGSARPHAWRLTAPLLIESIPVRLAHAFGGQCRIEAGSEAANKLPEAQRLTAEQVQAHPDSLHSPVAHDALAANPVGLGFVRDWYVEASAVTHVLAPQIEYPDHPVTLSVLDRIRAGKLENVASFVAGLGVRPKGLPERAKLAGTIDAAFIGSGAPLPVDFDFAAWNAAWPDQQIDAPQGDEIIELTNLCAPDTPGLKRDAEGNRVLRLSLPPSQPYLLVRFESGRLGPTPLEVDTVIVEPDTRTVSLVFRALVPRKPKIRRLEARQMPRAQWQHALQTAANPAPTQRQTAGS